MGVFTAYSSILLDDERTRLVFFLYFFLCSSGPGPCSHCAPLDNSVMIDDFEADYLFKSSWPEAGAVKGAARQAAGQTVLERLVDQRHLYNAVGARTRTNDEQDKLEETDKWNTNKSLVDSDGAHCSVNNTKRLFEFVFLPSFLSLFQLLLIPPQTTKIVRNMRS